MRSYHYRCNDHSLLTPAFKQWFIAPLIRFVPWVIPANVITIFSNLFVYLGLYLALNPGLLGIYTRLLVALCLLMYLIGDHLDGMQAKRTGTGSALGEFCDHYLDAFNNGIVLFTVFTIFDIHHPALVATVMVASYLAHMTVFYEQFKTGWLTFEKLGSLEGVLLSAFMIGLSTFQPFYTVLTYKLIGNFSVMEAIMTCTAFGGVMTFITTLKRTPDIKPGFWFFSIMFILVATLGTFVFNSFQLFILLTLYASLYIGRIMRGHLVDGTERHADWVVPFYFLFLSVPGFLNLSYSFWLLVVYLSACIGLLVIQTFSALKVYWVWSNLRV